MKFRLLALVCAISIVSQSCTDPCDTVPCLNGGVCLNGTCICPEGFEGINCESTVDPCEDILCENGQCELGTCNCDDGWEGDDCSTPIQPSRVVIKQVKLLDWPDLDDGGAWDEGNNTGPDIGIRVGYSGTTTLYQSTAWFPDVTTSDAPLYFGGLEIDVSQPESNVCFTALNFDATGSADPEWMGGTCGPLYNQSIANILGFQSPLPFSSGEYSWEIFMDYYWD